MLRSDIYLNCFSIFFFNATTTTAIYTLSLHDALPISAEVVAQVLFPGRSRDSLQVPERRLLVAQHLDLVLGEVADLQRSEEHTSELQSRLHLVCRLLLEKKKRTQ